jgi:hypothetical protein
MPLERSASTGFQGIRMVKWCWKSSRTRNTGIGVIGLLWLIVPFVAAAAEDVEVEPPPKSVTLDQLLTLPSALPVESGQHGGLTRGEWSGRFAEAEADVQTAKAELDESLDKLSEVVGKASNWKVAAPGLQAPPSENSPANYGLKQGVQRKREDVARAERALRDLIVEANLAGVPKDWHKKSGPLE